jgi:heme-degrading monooxygenase HmoA
VADRPFAVIYRWKVLPGEEDRFRERWREGTLRLKAEHGALGSCLARDAEGDFIAFARWPSEEARSAAFAASEPLEPWPGVISLEETRLTVEEDLLTGR